MSSYPLPIFFSFFKHCAFKTCLSLSRVKCFCVWRDSASQGKKNKLASRVLTLRYDELCDQCRRVYPLWVLHSGANGRKNLPFLSCVQGVCDCVLLWELQIFDQCHRPFIVKPWIYLSLSCSPISCIKMSSCTLNMLFFIWWIYNGFQVV